MRPRYRHRPWRTVVVLLSLFLLVAVRIYSSRDGGRVAEALSEGIYQVERVVDGDTLLLTNHARIRLQGIDAPETVQPNHPVEPWGPEAAAFTRRFVATGQVHLRFDRERKDRFGRFLAYVSVDDRMLNEELVRAGLATAELRYHYSEAMKRRFRAAQDEAKLAQRGIWSTPQPEGPR